MNRTQALCICIVIFLQQIIILKMHKNHKRLHTCVSNLIDANLAMVDDIIAIDKDLSKLEEQYNGKCKQPR